MTLNYIAEDSYCCCLFRFCKYDCLWWNSFEGLQIMFGSFMFILSLKNPSSHQTTKSWLLDSHKIHSIKQVVSSIILIQREFQGELSSLLIHIFLPSTCLKLYSMTDRKLEPLDWKLKKADYDIKTVFFWVIGEGLASLLSCKIESLSAILNL